MLAANDQTETNAKIEDMKVAKSRGENGGVKEKEGRIT